MTAILIVVDQRIDARCRDVGVVRFVEVRVEVGGNIAALVPVVLQIVLERINVCRRDVWIVAEIAVGIEAVDRPCRAGIDGELQTAFELAELQVMRQRVRVRGRDIGIGEKIVGRIEVRRGIASFPYAGLKRSVKCHFEQRRKRQNRA